MKNITDDTPIAMLTVGQLKEILSIDKIMDMDIRNLPETQRMTICMMPLMGSGVILHLAVQL